eukprot:830410-Heterocapsa_arctica.AAC.1
MPTLTPTTRTSTVCSTSSSANTTGGEALLHVHDRWHHQAKLDAAEDADLLEAVAQRRLPGSEQADPEHPEVHPVVRDLLLSIAEDGDETSLQVRHRQGEQATYPALGVSFEPSRSSFVVPFNAAI